MVASRRKEKRLDKEKKLEQMVLKTYYDFSNRGSYGGLERLHKATGVPVKKLKGITRKNKYTLCINRYKDVIQQIQR